MNRWNAGRAQGGGGARRVAWGLALGLGLAFTGPVGARGKGEDVVRPMVLPRARVLLKVASGAVHAVDVEVAATPDSRERGLMWRKELPGGQGMLFIFPDEEVQRFWMRNTLISLDMIFINSRGRVVGLVENTVPRSLHQRFVREPGRYVLEVPGGWSASVGLASGDTVRFEGLEHITVVP